MHSVFEVQADDAEAFVYTYFIFGGRQHYFLLRCEQAYDNLVVAAARKSNN